MSEASGQDERGGLRPLIISAPFGNYVQPAGATATLGTFTLLPRPGRWRRVLASVRYYPRIGAWVNKIGLRNPGIEWLAGRTREGRVDVSDKIVSIHGFDRGEWMALLERVGEMRPAAVELNMSCPNVGEIDWPADLFASAVGSGVRVIVKLPPVNFREMAGRAMEAGVRTFHCCNTIPVPAGGISGKPLKPVAIQCIGEVLSMAREAGVGEEVRIIGGGGITTPEDVDDYVDAGARHVAVGTKVMNPVYLFSHAGLRPIMERARERLG